MVPRNRLVQGGGERNAEVGGRSQLLAAPDEHRADDVVGKLGERFAHDGRVVLAVDERDRTAEPHRARHPRLVTSRSILPVYFSYSSVSESNWMIRSCPWNGCLRQIATCVPEISMTL